MRYVIDPERAEWVRRIFDWFVREQRSISWIVRELNRLNAPKDRRASTPHWRHQQAVNVLRNPKYVGVWAWGKSRTVRDPETGVVRYEERPEEECEQWLRHLPALRLIDDETFALAQARLDKNAEVFASHRDKKGRLNGSPLGPRAKHLLSGLVECGECGEIFHVCGTKYRCSRYAQGLCTCGTGLPRKLAERKILTAVGQRILEDADWLRLTIAEFKRAWSEYQRDVPDAIEELQRELAAVEAKIARLIDVIEDGHDDFEISTRLRDRKRQRAEIAVRLKELERNQQKHVVEPTEEWLRSKLAELGEVLQSGTPGAAEALRKLVGGAIVVEAVDRPCSERKFLRGRFHIHARQLCAAVSSASPRQAAENEPDAEGEEIVIDFFDPSTADHQRDEAKRLYDQGLLGVEIAQLLGVRRSRVTLLLKQWSEINGVELPDGRSRRWTLNNDSEEVPLYQRIADDVKTRWDEGMLLGDIATELSVNRDTVTAAVRHWHESRGLPVPDGRTRRKSLEVKGKPRTTRTNRNG